MASSETVTALQDEPLDALVWRAIGRTAGAVESVLQVNPGLAEVACAIPQGRRVVVPGEAAAQVDRPLVQLWD